MSDSERVTRLIATERSSSGSYNLGLYPPKDNLSKASKGTGESWPIMGSLESIIKPSQEFVTVNKKNN